MEKVFSSQELRNAKLYPMYSLAFLILSFFISCKEKSQKLELIWENDKAIGIAIPKSISNLDSLHIINVKQIFGSLTELADFFEFRSVIPLTAGLSYEVWNGKKMIGKLTVPLPNSKLAPVLTSIYPEIDTVPENLLKFYFVFSKPMRSGASLNHIFLLDKKGDTMQNVFLNLQPELWDTSGKVLTIWIDPGRIKRDLVLNKKLGNPLTQNSNYKLIVSNTWKDTQGLTLPKIYTKSFVVGAADHQIPDVSKWNLTLPKSRTTHPIVIDAKETLDHLLLAESLSILDFNNKEVAGTIMIRKDQILEFVPLKPWTGSKYVLQVNARLEDLAANNLNKVFDRDIRKEEGRNDDVVKREFKLRH